MSDKINKALLGLQFVSSGTQRVAKALADGKLELGELVDGLILGLGGDLINGITIKGRPVKQIVLLRGPAATGNKPITLGRVYRYVRRHVVREGLRTFYLAELPLEAGEYDNAGDE